MELNGIVRDTLAIENPHGTWQWGKNMLINKGHKSVSNEHGFKYEYLIPGIAIGSISTHKDIVYFVKNKEGVDEIGVVDTTKDSPSYEVKIKSNQFNFQLNCPIEGVFIYNFKGELIVSFCDGIKTNSNSPKVVNLDNPIVKLYPDKTLVNPDNFEKLTLYPKANQGALDYEYLDGGNIDGFSMYVTHAYILEDDSSLPFFTPSLLVHLGEGSDPVSKKGVKLKFSELDTKYSRLKLGIIVKKDNTLLAYESYVFNYTDSTLDVNLTTLSSFSTTTLDKIVIEKTVLEKINTITKYENQALVGDSVTKKFLDFQKYANLLKLEPVIYRSEIEQDTHFIPDEVYAFYIQPQYLDGTFGEAYHIPGNAPTGDEADLLNNRVKTKYNLWWLDDNIAYRNFHFENNGSISKFGYWQNKETYPDDFNFDSTIDYNAQPLGGENLRNTPVRYHRMPSLRYLNTIYPQNGLKGDNLNNKNFYKIGVNVKNFNSVIPAELKSQIQGYRLCYVKRNFGNSLVLGNFVMTRKSQVTWTQAGIPITWDSHSFNNSQTTVDNDYTRGNANDAIESALVHFGKGKLLGADLFKTKAALDISHIQSNYLFNVKEDTPIINLSDEELYMKVKSPLKYLPPNNLAADTLYLNEALNIELEDNYYLRKYIHSRVDTYVAPNVPALMDEIMGNLPEYNVVGNTIRVGFEDQMPTDYRYFANNITAYSFKEDLYPGFYNNDLVIAGYTNKLNNSNIQFLKGDVVNNNTVEATLFSTYYNRFSNNDRLTIQWYATTVKFKGLYSAFNFASLKTDEYESDGDSKTVGDNERAYRIDQDFLNSRDYDYDINAEEDLTSLNDIVAVTSFNPESNSINEFPFRINKSIKLPNESLTIEALRTFLINDYYEMPNDKGEIIALRGKEGTLFIQTRYSLFVANVKDKLQTGDTETYLGRSDLFDRPPKELMSDSKGYIGSNSKFACIIIKGIYVTINQENGQIFLVDNSVKEISDLGNKTWFWDNWRTNKEFKEKIQGSFYRIDNPFCSVGHLVSYDKEYDRLLFFKKDYKFKHQNLLDTGEITFDGEFYRNTDNELLDFNNNYYFENKSRTFSFDLKSGKWLFEHDYFPNIAFYTFDALYSGITNLNSKETKIYKHNDKSVKGLYYDKKFESYIDVIFNKNLNITKLYQSFHWVSTVINQNKGNEPFKTINKIMFYNEHQCSGIIHLTPDNIYNTKGRNNEWYFNDFKDILGNSNSPILDERGDLVNENLDNFKIWFEKSNFISKFIVVRLIIDNINNDDVFVHQVNIKSQINN